MTTRKQSRTGAVGAAALLGLLVSPTSAWAQADTEPPLPNVMLLIDTSGSMEFLTGLGANGKPQLPTCTGNPNGADPQNRWTTLATVLTGEIPKFACLEESRSTAAFASEYSVSGQPPYDYNYYLSHYRIGSLNDTVAPTQLCTLGPDTTKWPGTNPFLFPSDSIKTHVLGDTSKTCSPVSGASRLVQVDDGLLDVFREKARFGLMTFDSLPDHRTGFASNSVDAQGGFLGNWSYYAGWDTGGAGYAKGRPALCDVDQEIEVGARNPAAPPWEGRLMAFGDSGAALAEVTARNDQIQQALLAIRPYGATPLAGMMRDAEYFFREDTTNDRMQPNSGKPFGPYSDPYVLGGCRKQYIILLTDGVPNLDLRDSCASNQPGPPDGTCPYRAPSSTAKRLAQEGPVNQRVKTFVVGFAFSSATGNDLKPLDCTKLTGQNDNACANPQSDDLKACCEMARIAYEGGTTKPQFADSKPQLRKALNDILSEVAQQTTSRTVPVFASSGTGGGYSGNADGAVAGYNLLSSFRVSTGGLWRGVLERQRYVCEKNSGVYNVVAKDIDPQKGDRFSDNISSGKGAERRFFTVVPTDSQGTFSQRTMRVQTSINDGLGSVGSSPNTLSQGVFPSLSITSTMELSSSPALGSYCGTVKDPVSQDACRVRLLRWYTGLPSIDGSLFDRVNAPLGSIYHSTPVVIGPPSESLRDESYNNFVNAQKYRTPITYAATTDGQLHAFKLGPAKSDDTFRVDNDNNNELWSFIPPAILPDIKTIYPGVERRLLDVPLVARDVVFDRSRAGALDGSGGFNDWRTVLLTGYGPSIGGYFALDVTNPLYDLPASPGPKWLWQIISDANNQPLFGSSTTPAITTVFVKSPGASEPREVAVAILPGGATKSALGSQPAGGCTRVATGAQTTDGKWKFRPAVRCYSDDDVSRSVTVVRLDTGEVLRRFHRCKSNGQPPRPYDASLISRSTCAPLDSPMTSVPVVYPNGTGQTSTRAFVGDADGALWRINLADTDPSKWSVDPFFDAYAGYQSSPLAGQPVVSQPVASVDDVGNLVVIFATGDQDRFDGTPNQRNLLWSVREVPDYINNKVGSRANWHLGTGTNENITATPVGSANGDWNNGIRVAGPLSLFDSTLYFATYRPPVAGNNACDPGSSVLWGVHFLNNANAAADGDSGPTGALPLDGGIRPHAKAYTNSLIFGVGLQRLPSCFDTSSVSDPYIGYGNATSLTNVTPPQYQLVVQTGSKGTNTSNAQTNFERLTLQPPVSPSRFMSWAGVVE